MRKRNAAPADRPRVLVVGQGPPTRGGIPTFVIQLVTDPWLGQRVDLQYINTTPAGRVKTPGALDIGNLRDAFALASTLFRRARRVDVVHLNVSPVPTLPLVRALVLAGAARAGGAKVILHAHTGRVSSAASSRAYRGLLRVALRLVDALVVVSRSAESAAAGLGGRVLRIENGVDADRFETGPKALAPPVLAFVGTVCERKGLLDLRDALLASGLVKGRPGGLRVRIVGDAVQEGPGEFERIVRAYSEAGLEEVEFLGNIEPDRVADVLAEASIFCLPSFWEGFPISLLEAMAAGAAVVATTVGDVPFMLDGGDAGLLVAPRDVGALTSAIRLLVGDAERRAELGRAARARVEEKYSQTRSMRSLFRLYADLTRGGAQEDAVP